MTVGFSDVRLHWCSLFLLLFTRSLGNPRARNGKLNQKIERRIDVLMVTYVNRWWFGESRYQVPLFTYSKLLAYGKVMGSSQHTNPVTEVFVFAWWVYSTSTVPSFSLHPLPHMMLKVFLHLSCLCLCFL